MTDEMFTKERPMCQNALAGQQGEIAAGDRVRYTVMYNDGKGHGRAHIEHRPAFGRVTRVWPPNAPAMASIAVENPKPHAARYVTRKIRDITPAPLAGVYTRRQVDHALATAHGMIDQVAPHADCLERLAVTMWTLMGKRAPFTREQVNAMLNAAADLVATALNPEQTESGQTIWTADVLNLAVNVTGYLLDSPEGSLDAAIVASHTDTAPTFYELAEGTPEPARGTPAFDAALVRTVLGWIA